MPLLTDTGFLHWCDHAWLAGRRAQSAIYSSHTIRLPSTYAAVNRLVIVSWALPPSCEGVAATADVRKWLAEVCIGRVLGLHVCNCYPRAYPEPRSLVKQLHTCQNLRSRAGWLVMTHPCLLDHAQLCATMQLRQPVTSVKHGSDTSHLPSQPTSL